MTAADDDTDFALLGKQLEALLANETDALANTANFVGLLYTSMTNVNWLGVYVLRNDELVLGPFQGNPACVRIPLGHGVCGTAAADRRSLRVADVEQFPGHIACDPHSRSELVVPLTDGDRLLGVLDIDSPRRERFTAGDQDGVESLSRIFLRGLRGDGNTVGDFI